MKPPEAPPTGWLFPPKWVQERGAGIVAAWWRDDADTCEHHPEPALDAVVFAHRGIVFCRDCMVRAVGLEMAAHVFTDGRECDRCGQPAVVAYIARPALTAPGFFMIVFTCPDHGPVSHA